MAQIIIMHIVLADGSLSGKAAAPSFGPQGHTVQHHKSWSNLEPPKAQVFQTAMAILRPDLKIRLCDAVSHCINHLVTCNKTTELP